MPDHTPITASSAPPVPRREPAPRRTPLYLWDAVLRARIDLADERASPGAHRPPSARGVLVGALEAYVISLTERGHPVPYVLRDELRLHRRTCRDRYDGELDRLRDAPRFGR
jgi:hypothetical protein